MSSTSLSYPASGLSQALNSLAFINAPNVYIFPKYAKQPNKSSKQDLLFWSSLTLNRPPCHSSFTLGSLTIFSFFVSCFFFPLGSQHKQYKQGVRSNRATRLQWYRGASWIAWFSWINRFPGPFWTSRTTWLWQSDTLFLRKSKKRWPNPRYLC